MLGGNTKSTFDIAATGGRGQMTLRVRFPLANDQIANKRNASRMGQGLSQKAGLIIAPRKKPTAVQWYRGDYICLLQQFATRPTHPCGQSWGKIGSIPMFEGNNDLGDPVVIGDSSAGPVKIGGAGQARTTANAIAEIQFK